MEYAGEVIDYREFKSRAKHAQNHYYFMALNGDEVIDATNMGNISRFINHSCDPNAETQKVSEGDIISILKTDMCTDICQLIYFSVKL